MIASLERPVVPAPSPQQVLADFGPIYAANGFIGFVFAATGPVAIILSVGTSGGLSPAELASWIFGVFFINGLITVGMSWRYRQPLAFFWTIPGTVLVGPSLQHLSFPEVIGAFYATSVLILALGGIWLGQAGDAWPCRCRSSWAWWPECSCASASTWCVRCTAMLRSPPRWSSTFLLLSALPALGRRMPPLIGALLVGALVVIVLGRIDASALGSFQIVRPVVHGPVWSLAAMIELVVPLAITVLVVQNGQGFAVLQAAGHHPPVNTTTVMCGVGALFSAIVGAVSSCLTGPTNALITSSGERERHYTGAIFTGLLAIAFGLMAPAFTGLMLAAPKAYIMVLGGLAMLRVLQASFVASFKDRFTLGALISFLVTVADLAVLNIGAAFWGLVAGFIVSWLLEKRDFVTPADAS